MFPQSLPTRLLHVSQLASVVFCQNSPRYPQFGVANMSLSNNPFSVSDSLDISGSLHPDFSSCQSSLSKNSAASLFLFLSSYVGFGVDGFISNISLGSSYGWYFRLSQFELIFLSLLMLQIFVLRYIEILPINMNNLFLGDPSGKRRKREVNVDKVCRRDELAESMLRLLRKLDDGECFPFALCELTKLVNSQKHVPDSDVFHIPTETIALIEALKMSGVYREKYHSDCETNTALKFFEEAVRVGEIRATDFFLNGTICANRYPACPLTPQDVIHYFRILTEADILS